MAMDACIPLRRYVVCSMEMIDGVEDESGLDDRDAWILDLGDDIHSGIGVVISSGGAVDFEEDGEFFMGGYIMWEVVNIWG